jgi:cell division protein ZapA
MTPTTETAHAVEEKKNISVRIFGSDYPIVGVKDTQHMESLARYVDAKMNAVAKQSGLLSATKVAILAALNMAEELFRARGQQEKIGEVTEKRLAELAKKIDLYLEKC